MDNSSSSSSGTSTSSSSVSLQSSASFARGYQHRVPNPGVTNAAPTDKRLKDLVSKVAGTNEKLDPEVENLLVEIANDFLENVCTYACTLANHRKASAVDVQDVQINLEKNWNIRIPGFRVDNVSTVQSAALAGGANAMVGRLFRKPQTSFAHRDRMTLVLSARSQQEEREAQREKEKEKEKQAASSNDKEKGEGKEKDSKGDSKSSSSLSVGTANAALRMSSMHGQKKRKREE